MGIVYDIFSFMATIFDYLTWRGDLDFSVVPFNPVDNIILSQFSYLTMDGIVPGPDDKNSVTLELAAKIYDKKMRERAIHPSSIFYKEDLDLFKVLGNCKRYKNCRLFGFISSTDNTREFQFSATCINTNDDHCFVAYRGTDASFAGWKEDFNMTFMDVVPGQLEAVKYLEKMAPKMKGSIRVGGHSKGGNLAIYASSQCEELIQNRIVDVFCNDGPGFKEKVILSEGYMSIRERIRSYIPQSSIVGMLLEQGSDYAIVKSSTSSLMSHNLYTWDVTHDDIIQVEKTSTRTRFLNKTIREWMANHDDTDREKFVEALYHILNASGVQSIHELEKTWLVSTGKVLKSLAHVDDPTRHFIMKVMKDLFVSAGKSIDTILLPG